MFNISKPNVRYIIERNDTRSCFCIGPQNGEPVCPCKMRNLKQVDGRWIEIIDHGPVVPKTTVGTETAT